MLYFEGGVVVVVIVL